jgi:prolyl-tRNA synthetase
VTVLDSSIATSSSLFAVRAQSSTETVFLAGTEIAAYLKHLEKEELKVHEVDFEALKTEAEAAPAAAPKAAKDKEDAKIEGAIQIAIGVKKEVDFPQWYTNVCTLTRQFDTRSDSVIGPAQGRHAGLLQR